MVWWRYFRKTVGQLHFTRLCMHFVPARLGPVTRDSPVLRPARIACPEPSRQPAGRTPGSASSLASELHGAPRPGACYKTVNRDNSDIYHSYARFVTLSCTSSLIQVKSRPGPGAVFLLRTPRTARPQGPGRDRLPQLKRLRQFGTRNAPSPASETFPPGWFGLDRSPAFLAL
jgi:hypothetical protein